MELDVSFRLLVGCLLNNGSGIDAYSVALAGVALAGVALATGGINSLNNSSSYFGISNFSVGIGLLRAAASYHRSSEGNNCEIN